MSGEITSREVPLSHYLLRTAAGWLCLVGAALQIPAALYLVLASYRIFPDSPAEELAGLAFMHAAVVAALFGSWFYYGLHLRFRSSALLNSLLVLIAVAPFFPTYAALAAT